MLNKTYVFGEIKLTDKEAEDVKKYGYFEYNVDIEADLDDGTPIYILGRLSFSLKHLLDDKDDRFPLTSIKGEDDTK